MPDAWDVPCLSLTDPISPHYVFSNSLFKIRFLLYQHGLETGSLDIRQSSTSLLHHLTTDSCSMQTANGGRVFSYTGCQLVGSAFQNSTEQAYAF